MRNEARPHGMVTTSRQQTTPARKYPRASHRPPKSSQMMFRSVFMHSFSPVGVTFGSVVYPETSLNSVPCPGQVSTGPVQACPAGPGPPHRCLGIGLLDHGGLNVDLDLVA